MLPVGYTLVTQQECTMGYKDVEIKLFQLKKKGINNIFILIKKILKKNKFENVNLRQKYINKKPVEHRNLVPLPGLTQRYCIIGEA